MKKYIIWLNAIPVIAICYALRHAETWNIPGYADAVSYLLGMMYGVIGILKIAKYLKFSDKDKKENVVLLTDGLFLLICSAILYVAPIVLY